MVNVTQTFVYAFCIFCMIYLLTRDIFYRYFELGDDLQIRFTLIHEASFDFVLLILIHIPTYNNMFCLNFPYE